ncbi:Poly(U)-specific endoribonuclease-B [Nymphaea thermarum]|nr:Poly(U)-specific endoribonuclease-B [Nymphaea thermarum]
MEGLVRGLLNVALGEGDDDQPREERSRSTWAQAEFGEHEKGEKGPRYHQSSSHPYSESNNEEWTTVADHNDRKPHKQTHEVGFYRQEEREEKIHQSDYSTDQDSEKMEHWHGYKRPSSEQEYADEVSHVDLEPAEEELNNLSVACDKLWQLDLNRLVPGRDYEIDCGEGKKAYEKGDVARGALFSYLSEDVLHRPTYSRFCALLDNYNPCQGAKEVTTPEERQEQDAFIEEISRTAPIKYLYRYLLSKGIISEHYDDFKRRMRAIWFDLYGRAGASNSSSAFEHVFVGEIKGRGENQVSGFHNWIQPHSETQLLTIQFEWNGVLKSVSSTLVGVSPEFEIALYTVCFFAGEEDNHVQLGPYPVNIKCYRLGHEKIGSVFPIAQC